MSVLRTMEVVKIFVLILWVAMYVLVKQLATH